MFVIRSITNMPRDNNILWPRTQRDKPSDQFDLIDNDEPFADVPAHEIAALKRSGRIPSAAQFYDAPLIAEVTRLYSADIALYAKVIKRPLLFLNT